MILQEEGFDIYCSAFNTLDSDLKEFKPDLIVADYKLGEWETGGDICKRLKNDVATEEIPFIITSAALNLPKIAYECGADAYVEKPFDLVDFCNTIKDVLSL